MEVSYTQSFNKTKKERQQRAAMQALQFNGVWGEFNRKKRLEREKREGLKRRGLTAIFKQM